MEAVGIFVVIAVGMLALIWAARLVHQMVIDNEYLKIAKKG